VCEVGVLFVLAMGLLGWVDCSSDVDSGLNVVICQYLVYTTVVR
jgi:hypothetical protein